MTQENGQDTDAPADNAGAEGAGAAAGGAAAGRGAPGLTVNAQYVKDLSFENPRAPASLAQLKEPPKVQVNVNVGARHLAQQTYEVTLTINGTAKKDDATVFVVELTYAGLFTLPEDMKEELRRPLLFIECPRLLFPFARSIVADVTRDGGFPPLLINPVDFLQLYRRQAQQQQSGEGEEGQVSGEASAAQGGQAGAGQPVTSGGATTGS